MRYSQFDESAEAVRVRAAGVAIDSVVRAVHDRLDREAEKERKERRRVKMSKDELELIQEVLTSYVSDCFGRLQRKADSSPEALALERLMRTVDGLAFRINEALANAEFDEAVGAGSSAKVKGVKGVVYDRFRVSGGGE